jgi:uncharacterized protein
MSEKYEIHRLVENKNIHLLKKTIFQDHNYEIETINEDGYTPLGLAAFHNDCEIARVLLSAGAYPEYGGGWNTPLNLAVTGGFYEMTKLLLEFSADPNLRLDENNTVIISSVASGNPELVQLLINYGADVDAFSYDGSSALSQAANLGHLAIVKLLVEAGADVNLGIECNYFPLLIALRNNYQDIYNYLYPLTYEIGRQWKFPL